MKLLSIVLLAALAASCSSKKEKSSSEECAHYFAPLKERTDKLVAAGLKKKMSELRHEGIAAVNSSESSKEGVYSFLITKYGEVKKVRLVKRSKYEAMTDVVFESIKSLDPVSAPPAECVDGDEVKVTWTFTLKE